MRDEEEYLCDAAASELLMPSPMFDRDVRNSGPTVSSLFELARSYGTSLQATAIRFVQTRIWNCSFLFWGRQGPPPARRFVLERSIGGGKITVSLPNPSLLEKAEQNQTAVVRGRQRIQFGEIEKDYYTESVAIAEVALAKYSQ